MNLYQYLTEIDKKLDGRTKVALSKKAIYNIVKQAWALGKAEGQLEAKEKEPNSDVYDQFKDIFKGNK